MKKILLSFVVALMSISATWADEFTVGNIEIPQGGTVELEVGLNNTANQCAGFQFQLFLPEGITVAQDPDNDYLFTEGTRMSGKGFTTQMSWNTDHYQILSYNGSVKAMEGTNGTVISITLKANANLAKDAVLDASLKECKMTNKDEESILLNDELAFTITIGEPDDGRVVLDETSTTAPEASDGAVNVRVKRTIKANEWSTICLPFAMDATQVKAAFGNDVQLADADSYETTEDGGDIVGINIKFNNATAIEANHPYIIKVSSAITSFVVDGVVVAPADKERNRRTSLGSGSYFVGNYVSQTAVPEFCLFLSGNKFWYSLGDTKIKAFRGYFDLKDVLTDVEDTYGSRIIMSFDEATGINTIEHSSFTINRYYDLQGRSVENPGKGIYLKNGKKVVVK